MKTAYDLELEFISEIESRTGHDLEYWMQELKSKDLSKTKETTDYLKKEVGLNHMNASFLTGIFLNNGKPANDPALLLKKHFDPFPHQKPLYEKIESLVKAEFDNVQVVPTKGYISFRNPKEFAVAKINKNEIRVGMDLGEMPFNDIVEKAKSLGTMPRITHMIEIKEIGQINDHMQQRLIDANNNVNN